MSRAMSAAATIRPEASQAGDIESETSIRRPSLWRRRVSVWRMRSACRDVRADLQLFVSPLHRDDEFDVLAECLVG